jgi:hypothetical protein
MTRRLWLAAGGSLLVLSLAAVGYYYWATRVRWAWMRPEAPYQAPPREAPDYAQLQNWAAHNDLRDPSDLVPSGVPAASEHLADAFYVHPTTYVGKTWSSPLDPNSGSQQEKERVLATQASAFNGCCRVYAPHYREATFYSFVDASGSGTQALDLAYEDVERAFRHFIEHENRGWPFFVVGHSQGALHATRLLEEHVDSTDLRHRLVAAYVVGSRVPMDKFERSFKHLAPCRAEDDTGCIIAWDTWADDADPPFWLYRQVYGDAWELSLGRDVLCVNPLSWRADDQPAAPSLHLGGISGGTPAVRQPRHNGRTLSHVGSVLPLRTGARCGPSALHVDSLPDPPFPSMLSQGNYHLHDFSLFYMNIRENATVRARAFGRREHSR